MQWLWALKDYELIICNSSIEENLVVRMKTAIYYVDKLHVAMNHFSSNTLFLCQVTQQDVMKI